ncbi:MAG: type II toxin-antitoxin system RelE/ParE family toxin [Ruminococcaceae bacterium]|nr:type II toxin-antitoxin system RelE/ParE family toxin [Oscillospiraceae bacterium]
MKYKIIIQKHAEKFIRKLPKIESERILKAIYKLPEGNDIKILKGKKNKGLLRLRVGDYRIIYTIDNGELIVYVIDADNRGDIYKRY